MNEVETDYFMGTELVKTDLGNLRDVIDKLGGRFPYQINVEAQGFMPQNSDDMPCKCLTLARYLRIGEEKELTFLISEDGSFFGIVDKNFEFEKSDVELTILGRKMDIFEAKKLFIDLKYLFEN